MSRTFDVVTMFNVFYALPDPVRALSALARVAAENARLLIFDYVDRGRYQDDPILDSGGPFLPNPPKLPDLSDTFLASGWRIEEVRSIDEDYKRRYGALVDKITAKRAAIEALGGAEGYAHVHDLYSRPLADLRSGRLGGAIIEGQRAG